MQSRCLLITLILAVGVSFGQVPESSRIPPVKSKDQKFTHTALVPAIMLGSGFLSWRNSGFMSRGAIYDWRNRKYPNFHTRADNYLQFSPIVMVYLLDIFRVKPENDISNRTLILAKAEIIMSLIIYPMKELAHVERPDHSNFQSFPSGHTTQAFVAATFFHREFGKRSVWYSIGAYSAAASVGAMRILNNKHWLSDVLAGAGFGILSANLAYNTHRYKFGKKPKLTAVPAYFGGPGAVVSYRF